MPCVPSRRAPSRSRVLGIVALVVVALVAGAAFAVSAPRRGVTTISIESARLGRSMAVSVYTPPSFDPATAYPVLYLFHGSGGSEASWFGGRWRFDGVGIDEVADALIGSGSVRPLLIVSAAIHDSYGIDSAEPDTPDGYAHGPYERYILEELLPGIESRYRVDPRQRMVGGTSMGGFAALHVAFRHPQLFRAVAAVSPAVSVDVHDVRRWLFREGGREAHDPMLLASTAALDDLDVFLGIGDRDYGWMRESTPVLAERLRTRGVSVRLEEVAGGHDERTWRRLAEPMLRTLAGA